MTCLIVLRVMQGIRHLNQVEVEGQKMWQEQSIGIMATTVRSSAEANKQETER